jgi:hypothetical protein
MAWQTAKITLALVVHAALPDVFVTYASDRIIELNEYVLYRTKK